VVAGIALTDYGGKEKTYFYLKLIKLKWALIILLIIGGSTSYIKLRSELSYGESIFLKNRRQYDLMLLKLDNVSDIFYPFDPTKQPVDYYRGIANYYLANYKETLKNVLHASDITPFNPIILNNIGAAYEGLGDLQSAITSLERVKMYFPNYIKPQSSLIRFYYLTGKNDKAELLFDELISKYPNNQNLLEIKNRFRPNL
jgi:tetratricopeptide (TPR) repeat protein